MKWFAILGPLLFLGVAIAPSSNADVKKSVIVTVDEEELQEQRLIALIEGLISYYEQKFEPSDCGCEEQIEPRWSYPVLCTLLYPILVFSTILVHLFSYYKLYNRMEELAQDLNCYWASPEY